VDGGDLLAVRAAMTRAVDRARMQQLPTLVEAVSYRQRGHSVIDPAHYRSTDDLARAEAVDPVTAFADRVAEAGLLSESRLEELRRDVLDQVDHAVEFADQSDFPSVASLFDTVYATPVPNSPSALPGGRVA